MAALLFVVAGAAQAQLATFEQRQKFFCAAVWADYQEQVAKPSGREAFWRAEALFELGKIEEGKRQVGCGLDQLVPGNKENRWIHGGNSGFVAWPGLDCYIRYENFLVEKLKQRYRKIYAGAVFYKRLSTSNHKIMAAANPLGRYTDRHGNTLECVFDGADTINNQPVDYAHWPALENPWMHQPQPGAPFTIRAGTATYPFPP